MASAEDIVSLREKFLKEYEENPELYDEEDIERVRTGDDFFVSRFLNFLNQGPEKAFEQMKECYRWRKSFGVNHFDKGAFPLELTESGCIFPYLRDLNGAPVVHVRPKMCARIKKDFPEELERFCMHVANIVDIISCRELSWGLVMNCSDIGIADVDLNFIFHLLPSIRKYFPNGCRYCIIYGLHWSVNAICKVAMAAMPADSARKIRFMRKKEELETLIGNDHLPDFLGGSAVVPYQSFPSKAVLTELYGENIPI